jgi:hypothetical protein
MSVEGQLVEVQASYLRLLWVQGTDYHVSQISVVYIFNIQHGIPIRSPTKEEPYGTRRTH